jgi:hypothetical protein
VPHCFSQEVITSSEERRAERAQRKGAEDFDEEEAEALEVSVAQDLLGTPSQRPSSTQICSCALRL